MHRGQKITKGPQGGIVKGGWRVKVNDKTGSNKLECKNWSGWRNTGRNNDTNLF